MRLERRRYPEHGTERITRWQILPLDRIIFHDAVHRRGRLVILGEERYRFLGSTSPGCVAEVTVLRKPVGWMSRIGFALFPEWSVRTRESETELLEQIERDFRSGDPPIAP